MVRSFMLVCVGLLAATCAWFGLARPPRRADLVYSNSNGVNTLDPAQISWLPDIRVAINIWEGLTSYDPQTVAPREGVAYFPPDVSADGLVYTFKLRPAARWSNGDPITAADFIRGWRRCLEPGTAGDYAALFCDNIAGAREYYEWRNEQLDRLAGLVRVARGAGPPGDAGVSAERRHFLALEQHTAEMEQRFAGVGIEARDPHTLIVRLKRPCAYFLSLTAFPAFMPIHSSIELLRERYHGLPVTETGLVVYDPQWTKPDYHVRGYPGIVTNGPFAIREWRFKDHLLIAANPNYWDRASVALQTIDMLAYGDINGSIMAYEKGEVDCVFDMSCSYDHELARLALSGERKDFYCPVVMGTYYYNFNCKDAEILGRKNPFVDRRVRKAFALAVDKRTLVERVVANGNPVSNHLIPPGTIRGYESPAGLSYHPAAARELLAEAGYPGGAGLPPLEFLYTTGFNHEPIAQAIARMWESELGVRVELRGKEKKTFADDVQKHNFLIARANWYADYSDPTTFLDICTTGNGNNDSGYSNPAYDELLRQANAEIDAERRSELLREAERILVEEDFPIMPLYTHTNLMAVKPYVSGLYPNPRLIFPFKYVRVDKTAANFP